jgi:hypothetical protein
MPAFLIRSNKKAKTLVESSDGNDADNDVDNAGTDDAEDDSDEEKDIDSSARDREVVEEKAETNTK